MDKAYAVYENQQAYVYIDEISYQLTTGGGKPGQGYPCCMQLSTKRKQLEDEDDLLRREEIL